MLLSLSIALMTSQTLRTSSRVVVLITTVGLTACGDAPAPTSPTGTPGGGTDLLSVEVSCQSSLLIGERNPCIAVARFRSGQAPLVSFDATWSSSRPDIVAVDSQGVAKGVSAGQALITASYRGRDANASVAVTAEDALRIRAAAQQGEFKPGTTVTMWLQGYYSVASAETGRLSLRINDQSGTIATTVPSIVSKGGDFFLLSSTFVVPQTSTQVCRMAILEVGSMTIAEPQANVSELSCVTVRP
jgi:hypothetical protein